MSETFQQKVEEAIRNPRNMGEMKDADRVGTVGSVGCGDMVRMWLKFREEAGKKIIDKASFQSFGCETAIAAASLATELIKGKSVEEAASMSGDQLAADLGPLPPTKIHCTLLVEDALRSALGSGDPAKGKDAPSGSPANTPSLLDHMNAASERPSGVKVVFLDDESEV